MDGVGGRNTGTYPAIGRTLPDGHPDPAFGTNGFAVVPLEMSVNAFTIDAAQRVVVAGTLSDTATSVGIVLRLTLNGTPDRHVRHERPHRVHAAGR